MVYPGGQRSTGFDVYQYLRILIKDPSPAKPAEISARVSSLLDELSKAGATVISPAYSQVSMGGSSGVAFAVMDPEKYEKQASSLAIERARATAEEVAKKLGAKITGINAVNTNLMQGGIARSPYTTTDLLDFAYYSTSPDEINIRATVNVSFSIN